MLDFIYYPISALMWFWREALTYVGMSPDAGVTWLLAVVLLTATVKAIMTYPTVKSIRSSRRMQEITPRIQAVRERYKNDKAKIAEETQKIYKESGFNPLASCLPMLVQLPVFLGIFHVIRSFNRTGTQFGAPGLSAEENRQIANYFFKPEDVQSFLDARFFGVPLSAFMSMAEEQFQAFELGSNFGRTDIIMVAVPFVILIALFTHLNARYTLDRQKQRQASGKQPLPTGDNAQMMAMQQNMMGSMMLWVMPAMTIATGFIWPIGLLAYMLTNTLWTFVQTRLTYGTMDREEEREDAQKREKAQASAPAPGARKVDNRTKKQRKLDAERNQGSTAAEVQELIDAAAEQPVEEPQSIDRAAAQRARAQAKKKKR